MEKKVKVEDMQVQTPDTVEHDVFKIVKIGGNWRITVGDSIISKMVFATSEEAMAYIDSKPYELIINTTCYIYKLTENINKKSATKKK